MLKYFLLLVFTYAIIGCGNDNVAEDMPPPPDAQPGQPSPGAMAPGAPTTETDISEEELQLFVDASMNAQQVQQESQGEMLAIAEEEGIEVDTYNEIMQAQQMGQSPDELDISASDMESFERASERIQEVEVGMHEQLTLAIEEEGMDMDRFQEINMAVQQDPGLQQQLQMMMQEQMQQQQPTQPQQGY